MCLCSKTQVTCALIVVQELKIKENFANSVVAAAAKIVYKKLVISPKAWKTKVEGMPEEDESVENVTESFLLKALFALSSKRLKINSI